MREILFRGKIVDNGEWVYGYVWKNPRGQYFITEHDTLTMYAVIPETIGQYTGLKDRSANKIFEGDTFKDLEEDGMIWTCIFKEGAFCVEICGERGALMEYGYDDNAGGYGVIDCENISWYDGQLEIIGNIHDREEENGD